MWNALKANGISSMLICQWGAPYTSSSGLQGPNQWTQGISTSFRLSDDITNSWGSVNQIYNQAIHIAASGLIRPGHHADMDLLQVGNNGMTITEQATHFASWAMLKSALMLSTNIPNLSTEVQNIVSNKGLIAINQDDLGTPVVLVQRFTKNYDVWMGNLTNGDRAVLVVDQSNTARTLTLDLATLGLASATVANLWTSATTTAATSYSSSVQGHGSLALRLSDVKAAAPSSETINYIAASSGAVGGGASVSSCSACSSGKKVGSVGGSGGTLTLSGITSSKTSQTVRFDYINGDVGFSFGTATNDRLASISVNGGAGQTVSFPLSGYNWDKDVTRGYKVDLTGFKVGGGNTIKISGVSGGYAPDFDRIGVVTSGGSTGTTATVPSSTAAPTTSAPTSSPTGVCAFSSSSHMSL
jgi:alpha-galactosidase